MDIEALGRGEAITVEIDGQPVIFRSRDDLDAVPVGEISWCDYIDLTISVTDDTPTEEWSIDRRCPKCGGTAYEWVHPDYPPSGLGAFTAEIDGEDV